MFQLFDENEGELAGIVLVSGLLSLMAGCFLLNKSKGTKIAQIIFNALSLISIFVLVYVIIDEELSIGFGLLISMVLVIAAIILSAIPYKNSAN